jgi:hypothetical protein
MTGVAEGHVAGHLAQTFGHHGGVKAGRQGQAVRLKAVRLGRESGHGGERQNTCGGDKFHGRFSPVFLASI